MPATLADHLRALPDPELAALVALRPDLVVPVPADISALAVRAQSRLSVARALDGLDQFTLEVLDALRLSIMMEPDNPSPIDSVLALTAPSGVAASRVLAAVDQLRALCLVYGPASKPHLVTGVAEVCPPYPAGLGRPAAELSPAAAALVDDPARLRRTVLAVPPPARAVLDRLAAGPPIGTVATAALAGPESDSPVRCLVECHLLVAISADTVELPREVALLLRRDTGPLGPLHPEPPSPQVPHLEPAAVDRAGAGQAIEVVRRTEALLAALGAEPAPVLRSGGLGVREVKRLAKAVAIDEAATALLLEVGYAAGLLGGSDSDNGEPVFLPTASFDVWRTTSLAQRWHRLALAWLLMTRVPSMVGQRDERDRPMPALAPESERGTAPGVRRAVLAVLADADPGTAPTPADVRAILAWRSPRRATRSDAASAPGGHESALAEASAFGFTGRNALTGYARLLLSEVDSAAGMDTDDDPLGVHADPGAPARAVDALDALLPAPVDHVLLQADLTMVVPGPPEPALVAELALVADQESPSVFRVTPGSVRRALDAGHTPADLHTMFARTSRTPVPQALSYLIDDVARRHGGLRAGPAGAYLRSTDEMLLAEVLADQRLAGLALRRLAPTVLLSPYPTGRLLAVLREAGYAPVAEDMSGAAVLTRPRPRRAPPRPALSTRRDDPLGYARVSAPRLAGIVEQIRRGEAAARAARRAPVTLRAANGTAGPAGAQAHIQAMAVLQQALRDRARVWVGYVDAHGASASRLVRPVSIGAGYLRAEDERTEMLHTLALHRITGAELEQD